MSKVVVKDFNEYADFVTRLASKYSMDTFEDKLGTMALGLAGEVGEIWDLLRIPSNDWGLETHKEFCKELGDMLWYTVFGLKNVLDKDVQKIVQESTSKYRLHMTYCDNISISRSLESNASKIADISKKLIYHGMSWSHKIELQIYQHLCDILDSIVMAAIAFPKVSLQYIMQMNVEKLSERYSKLEFSTEEFMTKEAAKDV